MQNITFYPPKDIKDSKQSQKFAVTINASQPMGFNLPMLVPDSMEIVYSNDYFETTTRATLHKVGNNKYECEVPGFDTPQMVRYYLEYVDKNTQVLVKIRRQDFAKYNFVYRTGLYPI